MTKLHRKELKQDEIRLKVSEAVHSAKAHERQILYVIGIVILVGLIAFGWYYYDNRQQLQSQSLFGEGVDRFNAPVGDLTPGTPKPAYSYRTDFEKYKDAMKSFEKVFNQYPNTPAAEMARYEAGICAFYIKDYGRAEKYLKQSSEVSDKKVLYYQSRVALADLYNATGKSNQAIALLKDAAEKNNNFVPAEYLLMQIAESYEKAGDKKQAIASYQKIVNEYKDSPISYQAQMRLNEVGG